MINFDLDGDGELDAIELATAKTYFAQMLRDDDGDLLPDEMDDIMYDDDVELDGDW